MQHYLETVRELLHQFREWKAIQIPKEKNVEAGALANLRSIATITVMTRSIILYILAPFIFLYVCLLFCDLQVWLVCHREVLSVHWDI